ncbi:MAG TPA: tRNA (adenosine(37)-N6)-threonylcarbamoyltransferase complex ATPase subunit type 1 TsaE [Acidimicrobiales bacterium]|nr:tRNA (adenosine(37)-N6)-threonylcarbamoyltransferase complex ATPase subunit type 1 TsaE [Acidimicrobiales bacterium]
MIKAATTSVDDTRALAAGVAQLAAPGDLVILAGDLGAGKTAFAQGFAQGLGVEEPVTSPAFILVRTYEGRLPMVHLDVYRLDTMQELVDLGIAELLDEGAVTLIEWGDAVSAGLPADFLEVRLEPGAGPDDREVRIRTVGPAWPARARALKEAVAKWTV